MTRTWERGEREVTTTKGKNGGPVVKQRVVLILAPKVGRAW